MIDHVVELLPYLVGVWLSHDVALFYAPRFTVEAMAHDFILQPVVLSIYAAGENENALRNFDGRAVGIGAVVLAPGQHGVLVGYVAAILPELTQQCVVNYFELLRIVLSLQKFERDLFPRSPWRRKSVQPEGTDALVVGRRVLGDPLCGLFPHFFLRYYAAAGGAAPCNRAHDLVRLFPADFGHRMFKVYAVEGDLAVLSTLRALVAPAFLCSEVVAAFDI